ncbi:MAG: hypothetical protein LBT62_02620, partial [Deltaproteobacteria bacterium]|nr:hypothetical protein [Deltaproteobacteria bacterium]
MMLFVFLTVWLGLQAPSAAQSENASLAEAKKVLLLASADELGDSYLTQLDRALVLAYRASYETPFDPQVYKFLGRLSEIRSLFTSDPSERQDLDQTALAHFAHSEQLERERSRQAKERSASQNSASPGSANQGSPGQGFIDGEKVGGDDGAYSDPNLSELTWEARLRRGEATLQELTRRYTAENL